MWVFRRDIADEFHQFLKGGFHRPLLSENMETDFAPEAPALDFAGLSLREDQKTGVLGLNADLLLHGILLPKNAKGNAATPRWGSEVPRPGF